MIVEYRICLIGLFLLGVNYVFNNDKQVKCLVVPPFIGLSFTMKDTYLYSVVLLTINDNCFTANNGHDKGLQWMHFRIQVWTRRRRTKKVHRCTASGSKRTAIKLTSCHPFVWCLNSSCGMIVEYRICLIGRHFIRIPLWWMSQTPCCPNFNQSFFLYEKQIFVFSHHHVVISPNFVLDLSMLK